LARGQPDMHVSAERPGDLLPQQLTPLTKIAVKSFLYGRERPIAPALHRHWWHGSALALRLHHGRILAHATRYPALRRRVPARQPHSFPGRWVGEAVCGRGYGGGTSGRSMNEGQGANRDHIVTRHPFIRF